MGDDWSRDILFEILDRHNIAHQLVVDDTRPTPRKMRMFPDEDRSSRSYLQLAIESRKAVAPKIEQQLRSYIRDELPKCCAIVIADYAKGLFSKKLVAETCRLAHEGNVPIHLHVRRVLSKYLQY